LTLQVINTILTINYIFFPFPPHLSSRIDFGFIFSVYHQQ